MGWAVAIVMFLMIADKYGSDAAWEIAGETCKSIFIGVAFLVLGVIVLGGGVFAWKFFFC
jgi:hypothetical protein